MPYDYEMIDFGSSTPIKFHLQSIDTVNHHWHQSVELIYILNGSTNITVKEVTYTLKEDDLLLINPYEVHSLQAEHCVLASFKIQLSMFDKNVLSEIPLHFDCNSATTEDKSIFFDTKRLLALLIKANTEQNNSTQILSKSFSYALLYELISKFGIEEKQQDVEGNQSLSRMEEILNYINDHYHEKISLNTLAEVTYLTVPYLSRIFKRCMGINFSEYLTNVRLSFAVSDLTNTNDSIETIAEKNGFPNSRSFVTAFKDTYGHLPSAYRKDKYLSAQRPKVGSAMEVPNFTGFEQHNYLGRLGEYLGTQNVMLTGNSLGVKKIEAAPIIISQKGHPLKHTFKQTTSIGKAKHILFSGNQEMLRVLQKEIGFNYIKFHGLLDDDMMVYSEALDGTIELSFTYIDMVFDFLLSINLKPLMQLSFMPKALAQNSHRTMFYRESIISLPKNMNKWNYLIEKLVLHLQTRYGTKEVESWPFCLWNEPDSPTTMFGFENKEEFFKFYKETYFTVKKCNPNIIFGSPSFMYSSLEVGEWVKDFMDFCTENGCVPKFFNFHFYPITLEENPSPSLEKSSQLVLDKSENALKEHLMKILKNIKVNNWNVNHLYMTEWNSSISHRELLNDTAFSSAYITKNILENYDDIDSFGYWVLSDFIEEVKMVGELFHGGLGLFTYNGLKKSQFYAFTLLSKLGSHLIARGDSYFITKEKDSFKVMLYNYQHYSDLYASGELFDMTFTNRYTPFPNPKIKKILLPFAELENGEYIIIETIINKDHGSAFDKWVELGAMPIETAEELEYLKAVSVPKITKRKITVDNNLLTLSVELQPHEVRLIEIKPSFL
jgi:xylan 1,4-beta-xylosidase